MSFRERIYRFMQGRYGAYGGDALTRFLSGAVIVTWLLSIFRVPFCYMISLLLLFYMIFRLVSRNHYKRQQENNFYVKQEDKVKNFWNKLTGDIRQKKTHHIYKCPNCRQKIRVPRGKGRIEIRCPKCNTRFIKKS